jgi:riboflavin-specific deaminase-like protein
VKPTNRPRLIANFAITADGKVSTRNNSPTTFTSPADKQRLREIRALGDGLLAGAGTVASDSMTMGLSDRKLQHQRTRRGQTPEPLRALVTNSGLLDPNLSVFRNDRTPLIIFSTITMPLSIRSRLPHFCDIWLFESPSVPLLSALQILRDDYSLTSIVCEGGPRLFRSLADIHAIDELYVTFCPRLFGGQGAPTLTGLSSLRLSSSIKFRMTDAKNIGSEFHTHFVAQSQKVGYKV